MKTSNYYNEYSELEKEVLITLFNKYGQDSLVCKYAKNKLKRSEGSIRQHLSKMRKDGIIGDSKYTERRRIALATLSNKQTVVQQVMQPIVNEQKNDELTLIKLIISKLGKEQKLELIKSMLA